MIAGPGTGIGQIIVCSCVDKWRQLVRQAPGVEVIGPVRHAFIGEELPFAGLLTLMVQFSGYQDGIGPGLPDAVFPVVMIVAAKYPFSVAEDLIGAVLLGLIVFPYIIDF